MFDLIIANPPYGKSSSVSRKIVNKLLEIKAAGEIVCLAPYNTFQDCFQLVDKEAFTCLGAASDYFQDAAVHGLSLAKLNLNPEADTTFSSWKEVLFATLKGKIKDLAIAVDKYNKEHPSTYKATYAWLRRNFDSIIPKVVQKNCFLCTVWQPQNKVHTDPSSMDYPHNLHDKDFVKGYEDGGIIEFYTRQEFEHFRDWFYKVPGQSEEAQKTCIYNMLAIIDRMGNGSSTVHNYSYGIPNLDWSREWTDEEIIQELKEKAGLPIDWEL